MGEADGGWFTCVLQSPWLAAMVGSDVVGFVAWMCVLRVMKLSAAFPMSALSYVLVILASWVVFHEPIGTFQMVGSAAIVAGVLLMGRSGPDREQ
jgi:drug/metabolite transporter (DMT)-like permease